MMQESTSKYNKLLSFRHEEVIEYFSFCALSWNAVTITSSGPSFRVRRKVKTLVPSAIIEICTVIPKQLWILFSQYILIIILVTVSNDEYFIIFIIMILQLKFSKLQINSVT